MDCLINMCNRSNYVKETLPVIIIDWLKKQITRNRSGPVSPCYSRKS